MRDGYGALNFFLFLKNKDANEYLLLWPLRNQRHINTEGGEWEMATGGCRWMKFSRRSILGEGKERLLLLQHFLGHRELSGFPGNVAHKFVSF